MKKRISSLVVALVIICVIFSGCGKTGNSNSENNDVQKETYEINVSAAASLTEALLEIKSEYEKESNNVVNYNFAGSGILQKQIEEGAPCDIFISAAKDNMDKLQEQGIIDEKTRIDILGNTLTLIASKEKKESLTSLDGLNSDKVEKIAIGTPESVPAGKYAVSSLENLGMWENIKSKVVYAKDVKQVLEYVETGNVDCGFVYKSDAMFLESSVIVMDMPNDSHEPIVYPAAMLLNSNQPEASKDFFEFLKSEYSNKVFEKYGFNVI